MGKLSRCVLVVNLVQELGFVVSAFYEFRYLSAGARIKLGIF